METYFEWAVVGAGPAGIAAIGMLLDSHVSPARILWIDPHFAAGDFGQYWKHVSSNTKVKTFLEYFNSISSFHYAHRPQPFSLDQLDPEGHCVLDVVAEPLRWVSDHLCQQVTAVKDTVINLKIQNNYWNVHTKKNLYFAEKVILATGAEEKVMNPLNIETIDLKTALQPQQLAKQCSKNEVIAVFGSSHSAMIIIRQLIELGIKRIMNFYLTSIRYAVFLQDWTLYDNTGLKGDTAAWVRQNIVKNCLPNIQRYYSSEENVNKYLPHCHKAICAIGFTPRTIPVEGVHLLQYDTATGIIKIEGYMHLIFTVTPLGHQEYNVGLWKFVTGLRQVMPIWFEYAL